MLFHLLAIALLGLTVSANQQLKRQATDAAQFTSAADQLISQYLPSTALPALESAVSSAASAAQVSGDPLSLIYEALLSSSVPGWFSSAIPSGKNSLPLSMHNNRATGYVVKDSRIIAHIRFLAWSTQIAALESNINALRASSTPGGPILSASNVITTTNSAGSTITSTISPSSTGPISSTTITSTSVSGVIATAYVVPLNMTSSIAK